MSVQQISAIELQKKIHQQGDAFLLLDVREPYEFQIASIENSVLIPLNQLDQRLGELGQDQEIIVLCHHGIRSQQAAEHLVYRGFSTIYNLEGGIDAWSRQCDPKLIRY